MRRSPLYVFKDLTSTGIYNVPIDSTVLIEDIDGKGTPKTIKLVSKNGLQPTSSIQDLLNNADNYVDPFEITEIPSELQKIKKNISNDPNNPIYVYGWRILGRDSDKYAEIGQDAIDLSTVTATTGSNTYGASGQYSFATGVNTQATGTAASTFGINTIAPNRASVAFGSYNIGTNPNNILEVGIGDHFNRINAFEIDTNGVLSAPEMTIQDINQKGITALVTKEYSDQNLDSKLDKTGGTLTGDLEVQGNLNVSQNSSLHGDVIVYKELSIGKGSSSQSILRFKSTTAQPTEYPSIYWDNTSVPSNFFITTGDNIPKKLWYEGNDGHGSGLDADTIDGLEGDDIATKDYVNSSMTAYLNDKYDKTGGPINGDVTVVGNFRANSGSTFIGDVAINHVINDITFEENVEIKKDLTVRNNLNIKGKISVGVAPGESNSIINFADTSASSFTPALYWNNAAHKFQIKIDQDHLNYDLWHAGNFDPDSKRDINNNNFTSINVVDTLTAQKASINQVLSDLPVQGDVLSNNLKAESAVYVGLDMNATSRIFFGDQPTGNTNPSIYWDSSFGDFKVDTQSQTDNILWHSGNFDPGSLVGENGGTINGNLHITGELTVDQLAKFNGNVQFLDTIASNMFISGNVTTTGNISGNNITGNIVNINAVNGASKIIFKDENHSDQPSIYWKHPNDDFYVSTPTATDLQLWHAGNFDPDSKLDVGASTFDNITVQSNLISQGASFFNGEVTFGAAGAKSGFYMTGTDPNNGDTIHPSIYFDDNTGLLQYDGLVQDTNGDVSFVSSLTIWHSGNLTPAEFVSTHGDTIRGALYINNDTDGSGNITAHGSLYVEDVVDIQGAATFHSQITVSGDLEVNGAVIKLSNLPTTDPGVPGQLWNDSGTLKISQ